MKRVHRGFRVRTPTGAREPATQDETGSGVSMRLRIAAQ